MIPTTKLPRQVTEHAEPRNHFARSTPPPLMLPTSAVSLRKRRTTSSSSTFAHENISQSTIFKHDRRITDKEYRTYLASRFLLNFKSYLLFKFSITAAFTCNCFPLIFFYDTILAIQPFDDQWDDESAPRQTIGNWLRHAEWAPALLTDHQHRFVPSPFCLVLQTKPNMDVCWVNRAVKGNFDHLRRRGLIPSAKNL